MVDEEMKHVQILGVASAAIGIIKDIALDNERILTKEEIFAISDSHRLMFNYMGDLFDERKELQDKLSKIRYNFNILHQRFLKDMEQINH
jgi:hypothetical protein